VADEVTKSRFGFGDLPLAAIGQEEQGIGRLVDAADDMLGTTARTVSITGSDAAVAGTGIAAEAFADWSVRYAMRCDWRAMPAARRARAEGPT
jgi:hypothetical protein